MDLRQLRYFVQTVKMKSIQRAATTLGVSQPSISMSLGRLEGELGTALLIRHSRGITPTPAGLKLFTESTDILGRIDSLKKSIGANQLPKRRIVLGIVPSMNVMISEDLLGRCAAMLPHLSISIVEQLSHDLAQSIAKGKIDIALLGQDGRDKPRGELLVAEPLYFIRRRTSTTPSPTIGFDEMARHPLILTPPQNQIRGILDATASLRGRPLSVAIEMQSIPMINSLVAKGKGCTVLPLGAVQRLLNEKKVSAQQIMQPAMKRKLTLLAVPHFTEKTDSRELCELLRTMVRDASAQAQRAWKRL